MSKLNREMRFAKWAFANELGILFNLINHIVQMFQAEIARQHIGVSSVVRNPVNVSSRFLSVNV